MNKVAHYLQEHLGGEVMTGVDARKYFSTDGSVFEVIPAIIVYPRNENDVRKAARFTWQLAERGRVIPMTARGAGSVARPHDGRPTASSQAPTARRMCRAWSRTMRPVM